MFERLTDRARKVMALANQEAQRFNHEYMGTEHILLGLVKEGTGVGANVLKAFDIDLRKVRRETERLIKKSDFKLSQSPRAKKVIEYAIEEARGLDHEYIGTEHLLLGLLREGDGVGGALLANLGVTVERAREIVVEIVGPGGAKRLDVSPEPAGGLLAELKRIPAIERKISELTEQVAALVVETRRLRERLEQQRPP